MCHYCGRRAEACSKLELFSDFSLFLNQLQSPSQSIEYGVTEEAAARPTPGNREKVQGVFFFILHNETVPQNVIKTLFDLNSTSSLAH